MEPGRPSTYTQELADKICEHISNGESMRSVCRREDMPAMSSVFKWLREKDGFSEQYARACQERTEAQMEEIQATSEEAIEDIKDSVVDVKASNALVSAYKLKTDNLKWVMSKMNPKKYGDKVDVTSAGDALKGNTIVFSDFKDEANS